MSTSLTHWAASLASAVFQDPAGTLPGTLPVDPAGSIGAAGSEAPGAYAPLADALAPYSQPISLVYLVCYTILVWVVLSAPLMGARGRKRGAAILGVLGLGPLAMLVLGGTVPRTLETVNPFFRGSKTDEVFLYVTGSVEAPGWQWVVVALVALWVPALLIWMRAKREPNAPITLFYVLVTSVWFLGLRVAAELTAGPEELDFATRVNHFFVHLLPFVGFYVGRRGGGFFAFLGQVILANVLFRGLLVGWSYFATTMDLGTWVDVGVVTDFQPPEMFGRQLDEVVLHDASSAERWKSAMLIPQMVLWGAIGTVVGVVLGFVPWLIARRNPDV